MGKQGDHRSPIARAELRLAARDPMTTPATPMMRTSTPTSANQAPRREWSGTVSRHGLNSPPSGPTTPIAVQALGAVAYETDEAIRKMMPTQIGRSLKDKPLASPTLIGVTSFCLSNDPGDEPTRREAEWGAPSPSYPSAPGLRRRSASRSASLTSRSDVKASATSGSRTTTLDPSLNRST